MTIDNKFAELRQKAEEVLKNKGFEHDESYVNDIEKLVEELNIRQIELEMQNLELQTSFDKLNSEKRKYQDLYHNAPVAYFTINTSGNIYDLNKAAANMLKRPVQAFYKTSIFPYLEGNSKIKFTKFFKEVFKSGRIENCDIDFIDSENYIINTKLSASAYFDLGLQINLCRCAITDITFEKEFQRDLKAEKQKLDIIFDNVSEGIIISRSANESIIYGNRAFCHLFGYNASDIPLIHLNQIYPPANSNHDVAETGLNTREKLNVPCLKSDGTIFYADIRFTQIVFDGIECDLITYTDVTVRRAIEKDRKEYEQKLNKVYAILDVGITVTDEQGNIIESNRASENILGITREEQLSRNLSDREWKILRPDFSVMPPEEFAGVRAVRENRTVSNVVMGVLKPGNQVTWISVNATPVDIPGFGAVISFIDITESLQAHMALQESEQRLKHYINSTSDIVFTMDNMQRHTGIYGDWPKKTGRTAADYLGKTPEEIMGEAAKVHQEATDKALKGQFVTYEWNICFNNSHLFFQTSLSPLFNGNEITGLIGVGRDITALKKYENQLKELNATKDKLFSILAHDLRGPFNALLGFSDLLIENLNNYDIEKIEFQLRQINKIAGNTFGLLEDLLIWSRSQSKKLTFDTRKVVLADACNEIIRNLKENAEAKKIQITFSDPQHIKLKAELNMLKVILRNLISNAIKFTGNNGIIKISAVAENHFATIVISDNGIGIEQSNIKRIWDLTRQYTRLGTANERGTGLGLTIARNLLKNTEVKSGCKAYREKEAILYLPFRFMSKFCCGLSSNLISNYSHFHSNIFPFLKLFCRKSFAMRVILFFSVVLLLFSCNSNMKEESRKAFRYNESKGITTLDPAFARRENEIRPISQIYNGLIEMDDSLRIKPSIAKTWHVSPDGTGYTFLLRNDVFFHHHPLFPGGKGRKVNAYDFVYSFNRILDPKIASPGLWVFSQVDTSGQPFRALNDSVFTIKLVRPFASFLGLLSMPYCYVVPKEIAESYGRDFRSNPVGTGPFRLKIWREGEKLVLEKNPEYFEMDSSGRRLPYLDAISVTFITEKQSEFLEFMKGNLDFLSGIQTAYKDVLFTRSGLLNPKYKDRFQLITQPYLNTEYLGFMLDNSIIRHPYQQKALRQAINYGFDRSELIKYLRNNLGTPAYNGFIPKGLPAFDKDIEVYRYNPDSARRLLALSGYPNGKGLPPVILTTTADYVDICEYIQHELAGIGIPVQIEVSNGATFREMVAHSKLAFFSWILDC